MTKIINLAGPPGCGKSTCASYLFSQMKMLDLKVELVTEFPKELTYEKHIQKLKNQATIFGEQEWRLSRLLHQVDYIVSDSPLFLGPVYAQKDYPKSFSKFALDIFNRYNNINFLLRRKKKYQNFGRNQTLQQSDVIGVKIKNFLDSNRIRYYEVDGNQDGYNLILNFILNKH